MVCLSNCFYVINYFDVYKLGRFLLMLYLDLIFLAFGIYNKSFCHYIAINVYSKD